MTENRNLVVSVRNALDLSQAADVTVAERAASRPLRALLEEALRARGGQGVLESQRATQLLALLRRADISLVAQSPSGAMVPLESAASPHDLAEVSLPGGATRSSVQVILTRKVVGGSDPR